MIHLEHALIFLFNKEKHVKNIGIQFLQSFIKFFDYNLTKTKILKIGTISASLNDILDFNINIAKSQPRLTFRVLCQKVFFFKRSDPLIQRYILQLLKPWMFNLIELFYFFEENSLFEKCNSQDKIKILQIIEDLIHITVSYSDSIYELKEQIWAPLSNNLALVNYAIKSFIKISIASTRNLQIIDNLLIASVALGETYKNQITNFLLESLESFIDTINYTKKNCCKIDNLDDSLTTHLKFMNYLLKNDCLERIKSDIYLVNCVLPYILYYCLLHISLHTSVDRISISFSLICNCLESISHMKDINLTCILIYIINPATLTENIRLIAGKSLNIISKKYLRSQSSRSTSISQIIAQLTNSSTAKLIETLSKIINHVLSSCVNENPSLNWIDDYNVIVSRFAFVSCPNLQYRALILFGLNMDTSEESLNKLFLAMGNVSFSAKKQELNVFNSAMYALRKYFNPDRELSLNLISKFFWLTILSLMNFEKILMESLEVWDKKACFKTVLKTVGLNFELSFPFSLSSLIVKGLRSNEKKIKKTSISILKKLLQMTSKTIESDNSYVIDIRNLPYFIGKFDFKYYYLALLSFSHELNFSTIENKTCFFYVKCYNLGTEQDYFYIGNTRFSSKIRPLTLEPILCILILLKNLQYTIIQQDAIYLLQFLKCFCQEFIIPFLACDSLLEGIMVERLINFNETKTVELINDLLLMTSKQFSVGKGQNLDFISCKNLNFIFLAKGFFGFISIISHFQI
ncbi:hypothetical protein HZS_1525, partial [Henneguya salminicola]